MPRDVPDHYAALGVPEDADARAIRRAWRRAAFRLHPDRRRDLRADEAHRRFLELREAYAVLADPAARARYDAARRPVVVPAKPAAARSGLAPFIREAASAAGGPGPVGRDAKGRRQPEALLRERLARRDFFPGVSRLAFWLEVALALVLIACSVLLVLLDASFRDGLRPAAIPFVVFVSAVGVIRIVRAGARSIRYRRADAAESARLAEILAARRRGGPT